jgi:RNA polymerase sigma-70 factor (ECF subfamily)
MNDRTVRRADAPGGSAGGPGAGPFAEKGPASRPASGPANRRPATAPASADTDLAVDIRTLLEQGAVDEARDRFAELVSRHQRRALRIAYQYLRDAADADEAVQDAFLKVFTHIGSYREAWPFEVWFTRILINGCLDRRKARARRERWFSSSEDSRPDEARSAFGGATPLDPEARLLARERREKLASAIDRLDGRQRTVFMLCHYGDCTPREVSAITGLNESTVRVHLFRAARKLRGLLGGKP